MVRVPRPRAATMWSALAAALVVVARWRSLRVGLIGVAGLVAAAVTIGGGTALGATPPGVAYGDEASQHDQQLLRPRRRQRHRHTVADDLQVPADPKLTDDYHLNRPGAPMFTDVEG
jgi:hypothetical protein